MLDSNLTQTEAKQYLCQPHLIKTVLLATDGSNKGDMALDNAIRLVKSAGGRLVITYFANPADCALFDGFPCQDDEEWRAYGQQTLNRLAEYARKQAVPEVATILEKHQGEETLTALAQLVNADLIVLASHSFKV